MPIVTVICIIVSKKLCSCDEMQYKVHHRIATPDATDEEFLKARIAFRKEVIKESNTMPNDSQQTSLLLDHVLTVKSADGLATLVDKSSLSLVSLALDQYDNCAFVFF